MHLHMHLLFWRGLTPSLLQAAGGIPALAHLIAAINRVVMALLQPIEHVRHLLRDLTNEKSPHAALFKYQNPSSHMQQFVDDFQRTVDLSNVHKHAPTCYKTKQGTSSCRLGRSVQLKEQTGCKEIVATQPDRTTPEIYFEVLGKIQPPAEAITSRRNLSTMPVAVRNSGVIMYYLKRPTILLIKYSEIESTESTTSFLVLPPKEQKQFDEIDESDRIKLNRILEKRNGDVVEYNPAKSAVLGCNTNSSILGSDAQAKAALCYVLKYMVKPPAELAHSLSLLHHARRTIELYPSKAADTGTVIRTGMHFLNKVVNELSGAVEISAPMAAAAIQGMLAEMSSESFWMAYVTAAASYARQHPENLIVNTEQEFESIEPDNDSISTNLLDDIEEVMDDASNVDENDEIETAIKTDDCEEDHIILDNFFEEAPS